MIEIILSGNFIDNNSLQSENADEGIDVMPVKYCNSSNANIPFPLNSVPIVVTAAASSYDSSPSPSVSQLVMQIAFTNASSN